MLKKCLNCGKEFDAKRNRIRFCSVSCGASFSGKERWKDSWIIVKCKTCGEDFKTKKLYQHCYCSFSCAAKGREHKPKRQIGEVWMRPSDKYFVIKTEDGTYEYHRWLMEQKIGRRLSREEIVHHIDFNKLNNNKLNLITLCKSCHAHHHHKYNLDSVEELNKFLNIIKMHYE